MKVLTALILAGFSCLSMAGEQVANTDQAGQPQVEQYNYGMKLDIAKVISTTEVPNVCAVVPTQMTYIDHQGQQHTVEYLVMGNGCSNG